MKSRTVAGYILASAAAATFGYSLYRVMDIGTCSSSGFNEYGPTQTCPSGTAVFILALIGSVFVLLFAAFLAESGTVVFSGLFLAGGIGALANGGEVGIILAVVFIPIGIAPLFTGRLGARKRQMAQNLMATGLQGTGEITQVDDTGITINDNPRVKLHFRITPKDGSAPFDTTKAITASRVAIPRVGDTYPVWYDAADHSKFAFGMASNAQGREVSARLLQDMRARTAAASPMFQPAAGAATAASGTDVASVSAAAGLGGDSDSAKLDKVAKLAELHKAGVLTDAEFAAKKAQLLSEL